MESIKTTKAPAPPPKITRAQITQIKEKSIKVEPAAPVVRKKKKTISASKMIETYL